MNFLLDNRLVKELILAAKESPRKRSHKNIHASLDEPVQRVCMGLIKGTYVRPHHHPQSNKWELLLCLQGDVDVMIFDREGKITKRHSLISGSGIQIEAGTYHTLLPISEEAAVLEVKEGPYIPAVKSDFAVWAPEEGHEKVKDFLVWLENAYRGDSYQTT